MISVTNTTISTGASSGTVTRRKTCHSVAPSVRAASSTSRGIGGEPGGDHHHREPCPDPDVGDHHRGVISFGPSQATPLNGAAKSSRAIAPR